MDDLLSEITLLYVEDEDDIRELLDKFLSRKVKEFYISKDGKEGLESFKQHKPDIVLTDIKMPNMDGLVMAKEIRDINNDVPIIILTAHSEANYFMDAIELGVSGFLLKPLYKEKLLDLLIENAKIVLFEKEKKRQNKLLQEVINLQPAIIFSADEKKDILFMNKLFIECFTYSGNSDDSVEIGVCDYLKQHNNVAVVNESKDIFWIDYIFENPNINFKISVNKDSKSSEFYVQTKLVKQNNNNKIVVVINFFDITEV